MTQEEYNRRYFNPDSSIWFCGFGLTPAYVVPFDESVLENGDLISNGRWTLIYSKDELYTGICGFRIKSHIDLKNIDKFTIIKRDEIVYSKWNQI